MSVKVREKLLKDGQKSLYLDIYHNGRRAYEFLNIHLSAKRDEREKNREAKTLAENIRAKRELEMQTSDHGFTPTFKRKTDFKAYFKRFYEDKAKHEGLRGTENYKNCLKHLEAYTGGQPVQIGSIDAAWIEGFKSHLTAHMKENTANNLLAKVKAAMSKAFKEGYITKNPALDVKYFPNKEVEKSFLTADEVATLAATTAPKPPVKLAFLFGCHTGLRLSDIKALTWGDIKNGKIHFRQRKTQGFEYMDLNQTALSILSQCKSKSEIPLPEKPIFNIPGKGHVNAYLKPWLKAAKIGKHVSFHTSRHTFATSLLTAGMDIFTVSKLMGHKSMASTAVYAKIVDSKKLNAVESLPQIEVVA